MLEQTVKLVNPLGLHARAAAKLVRCAAQFESRIILRNKKANASANAKSILSLLALAASYGVTLDMMINGPDERQAADAITDLFTNGFGEIEF